MTDKEYIQVSNLARIAMMIKISDGIERGSAYAVAESDIRPIVRRLYGILRELEGVTRRAGEEEVLGIAS